MDGTTLPLEKYRVSGDQVEMHCNWRIGVKLYYPNFFNQLLQAGYAILTGAYKH
jgi:hypothetical protein